MDQAQKIFALIGVSISLFFCFGCRSVFETQKHSVHSAISSPPNKNDFLKAITLLNSTNEPPSVWLDIANDLHYSLRQRQVAVLQLFERHFKVGMTVADLDRLLHEPKWLERKDIKQVFLSGVVIVKVDQDESGIRIDILSNDAQIQLCIEGSVSQEEFYEYISGINKRDSVGKLAIRQFGCFEKTWDDQHLLINGYGLRPM